MKSFYIPIALAAQNSRYRASTRDRTSARVSSSASASARDRASDSARDSSRTRKLEIIEKLPLSTQSSRYRAGAGNRASARDSTRTRKLEIIEKLPLSTQSSRYRAGAGNRASTRDSTSANASDSASTRELQIIEKFLHPYYLLVHKVQKNFLPSCNGWVSPPPHMSPQLKLHSVEYCID